MSDEQPELKGPDLARAALSRARAAARAKGLSPGAPRARARRADPARSGSGPDGRDPVRFGDMVRRLVAERGWEQTTSAAGVLANWDRLVGPEVAEHCRPVSLTDGELVLVAESSAWATQLRLLTRTMTKRLTEQVGEGVVTTIVVRGPLRQSACAGCRAVDPGTPTAEQLRALGRSLSRADPDPWSPTRGGAAARQRPPEARSGAPAAMLIASSRRSGSPGTPPGSPARARGVRSGRCAGRSAEQEAESRP